MRKRLFLLIFFSVFLLTSNCCFAQQTIEKEMDVQHTVFLELGGNSIFFYNITYDCSFQLAEKRKIAAGLGFQYFPGSSDSFLFSNPFIGFSPQINYLYGQKHYLEIGTGITFLNEREGLCIPIRIGYRYQRDNGGLFWKIAFVPLFGEDLYFEMGTSKLPFFPSVGIAFGYTFKSKKN